MLEFVPIKHGGGVIVDSKPQQKFEKPDNCILECVQNAIDAAIEKNGKREKTILKFHFTQVKKYKPQEKEGKITVKKSKEVPKKELSKEKIVVKKPIEKKDVVPWNGTGERQFFNKKGQVIREGYFENGYLLKGNMYKYASSGQKTQTIVYEDGKIIKGEGQGRLCISQSWPGQMRTVYGDHQRFIDTYFSQFKGYYFTGDGAKRDSDGYYWITGRVDDVLNVSGHRLGTAEIEGAIGAYFEVAEAAIVGYPHAIKGEAIYAFVTLMTGTDESADTFSGIKQKVREIIGPHATPDKIQITQGLPKTRSGKIMRRILRNIAKNDIDDMGDISTLADPSVVKDLVKNRVKL